MCLWRTHKSIMTTNENYAKYCRPVENTSENTTNTLMLCHGASAKSRILTVTQRIIQTHPKMPKILNAFRKLKK